MDATYKQDGGLDLHLTEKETELWVANWWDDELPLYECMRLVIIEAMAHGGTTIAEERALDAREALQRELDQGDG